MKKEDVRPGIIIANKVLIDVGFFEVIEQKIDGSWKMRWGSNTRYLYDGELKFWYIVEENTMNSDEVIRRGMRRNRTLHGDFWICPCKPTIENKIGHGKKCPSCQRTEESEILRGHKEYLRGMPPKF